MEEEGLHNCKELLSFTTMLSNTNLPILNTESASQPARSSSLPLQDITKDCMGKNSCFSFSTDLLTNRVNEADQELDDDHEIELEEKSALLFSGKLSEDLSSPDIISEEIQLTQQNDKLQRNSWRKVLKSSGNSSLLSIERIGSQIGSSFHNLFHNLPGPCTGCQYNRIDHVSMAPRYSGAQDWEDHSYQRTMPNTVGCSDQGLVTPKTNTLLSPNIFEPDNPGLVARCACMDSPLVG